jgi:hypothetical protein
MEAPTIRADGKFAAKIGNSSVRGRTVSTIVAKCPNVSTVGLSEETLASFSIPANAMSAEGDQVKLHALFSLQNTGNFKTINITVGGTTVISSTTAVSGYAVLNATITRTANANQQFVWAELGVGIYQFSTLSNSESSPIVVALKGTTPDNDGDLTLRYYNAYLVCE